MLTTVEAEIDVKGNVRLLEPLELTKTSRAIVTVLDVESNREDRKGKQGKFLELLSSQKFANRKSYPAEEIDAQIEEIRNSWE